ncbi:MAG: beta-ketoacyl synthase N-terminal-like domain-containing protein [Chthoniobacterales bacterium]
MSIRLAGMGWVTPLGRGIGQVWEALRRGERANTEQVSSPLNERTYPVYRVPQSATATLPPHSRLRRSSAISRFAVAAGLDALEEAGLKLDAEAAARTALVFASANGGVVYTKRFYHEVVETGARAASPLLFPETVFNAPASHLAAILGITGASYTVVGDGAVGLLAMKMAEDLMASEALDQCLVVAAEEVDWLLCDAYRRWRLLRATAPVEPFALPARGTILSEGAGALVLSRAGDVRLEQVDPGSNFARQREAPTHVGRVVANLAGSEIDLVSASANGTFVDEAERRAFAEYCPHARVYPIKGALGEGVGAASLWQVICAGQALRTNTLPTASQTVLHAGEVTVDARVERHAFGRAIVSACGLNQQVAGLALSLAN